MHDLLYLVESFLDLHAVPILEILDVQLLQLVEVSLVDKLWHFNTVEKDHRMPNEQSLPVLVSSSDRIMKVCVATMTTS